MKVTTKRTSVFASLWILGFTALHARSGEALFNALVKKGILNNQEAEDIRGGKIKNYHQVAVRKLPLFNHITDPKFYGNTQTVALPFVTFVTLKFHDSRRFVTFWRQFFPRIKGVDGILRLSSQGGWCRDMIID